jgi:hypothetical protein
MTDFKCSLCLVTGVSRRGTGFVVYQSPIEVSYIVTCAHVVADEETILVEGHPAQIIALGDKSKSLDLAVLEVNRLENKVPLVLSNGGKAGQKIQIPGIAKSDSTLRPLNGFLGELINPWSDSGHCSVDQWDLNINEGEYTIRDGYSGSPVVDIESGSVIGVVSHKAGKSKGIAISIRSLEQVWKEMPLDSLKKNDMDNNSNSSNVFFNLYTEQLQTRLKQLNRNIAATERMIKRLEEDINDLDTIRPYIENHTHKAIIIDRQRISIQQSCLDQEEKLNDLVKERADVSGELDRRKT